MPHTHDGCSNGGNHERSNRTMLRAEAIFAVLGALQLVAALLLGRFAVAVDGLHNLVDAPYLEVLRRSRIMARHDRGGWWWTCIVLPLVPFGCALGALAGAVGLWLVGAALSSGSRGAGLMLGLELVSLVVNVVLARLLHRDDDHSDTISLAGIWHLSGDASAAGAAVTAYVAILLGAPPQPWDFWAGMAGAGVVTLVHLPIAWRSARDFLAHRGEHRHPTGRLVVRRVR